MIAFHWVSFQPNSQSGAAKTRLMFHSLPTFLAHQLILLVADCKPGTERSNSTIRLSGQQECNQQKRKTTTWHRFRTGQHTRMFSSCCDSYDAHCCWSDFTCSRNKSFSPSLLNMISSCRDSYAVHCSWSDFRCSFNISFSRSFSNMIALTSWAWNGKRTHLC